MKQSQFDENKFKIALFTGGVIFTTAMYFSNVFVWWVGGYPSGQVPTRNEISGGLAILWYSFMFIRLAVYIVLGYWLIKGSNHKFRTQDAIILGLSIASLNRLLHLVLTLDSIYQAAFAASIPLLLSFAIAIAGAVVHVLFMGFLSAIGGWLAK